MNVKATSSLKQEPVAKLYAKALFELAQEKGELASVQESLDGLLDALTEVPRLRQALATYTFSVEEREKLAEVLAELMGLHQRVRRFLQLLVSKNRIELFEGMHAAFRALVDESNGTVRGTVITVEPMTESEKTDLSNAFERKLNKKVVLDSITDKEILGGLIVKIQGLTFDGSLQTTIRRLRESLERQSL